MNPTLRKEVKAWGEGPLRPKEISRYLSKNSTVFALLTEAVALTEVQSINQSSVISSIMFLKTSLWVGLVYGNWTWHYAYLFLFIVNGAQERGKTLTSYQEEGNKTSHWLEMLYIHIRLWWLFKGLKIIELDMRLKKGLMFVHGRETMFGE